MGKILIADDTRFWRDFAEAVLTREGHTVLTADDGLEALALLHKGSADLVLLDMEMPKLPGLSCLEHIRQNPKMKDVPVIMLTGAMEKAKIIRAKSLGAVDYLIKSGLSVTELIARVEKHLCKPASAPEPAAAPGPETEDKISPALGYWMGDPMVNDAISARIDH